MPSSEDQRFVNRGVFSDASIQDYLSEAEEQLSGIEQQLLALEEDRSAAPAVNDLFRHLHGLKGNTGLLLSEAQSPLPPAHPLHYLQKGSHAVESVADQFRKAEAFHVSDEEMEFLFQALDFLQTQIRAFQEDRVAPVSNPVFLGRLGLSVSDFATEEAAPESSDDVFQNVGPQAAAASRMFLEQLPSADPATLKNLHRSIDTLLKAARYGGHNLVAALAEQQLARVQEALNAGEAPSALSLSELRALQEEIEAHFSGLLEDAEPEASTPSTASTPAEDETPQAAEARRGVIRVDQRKIDELMRMAGQMSVLRNQFAELVAKAGRATSAQALEEELRALNDNFSRTADELEHGVMALRLFPLRNLFQRLQRMVRDLSVSLRKEIRLVTEGEDIQIDKALLDRLGEPLVHLLRNSADHGIEPPETRTSQGKPAEGTITVRAFREASSVVIEIADDGKGLDTAAILNRAIQAGLVTSAQAAEWSEVAVRELIFHPGFSTAEAVTSVSGRGVGMDVVRSTIRSLRGSVTVDSAPGAGTVFRLRLPTSVLITRGILVESAGEEYILPVDSIRDLTRVDAGELREYRDTRLAVIDGQALPVLFLPELLGGAPSETIVDALSVAVLDRGHAPFGLAVDRFMGEVQVVTQPLNNPFAGFNLCVGAAILGNGRVVLVLDPEELSKRAFGAQISAPRTEEHSGGLHHQSLEGLAHHV